jgi:hypothetical protein
MLFLVVTYYIYSVCRSQQWLFMTEYASNTIIFVFIDIFVFMTNYDFESRMSFDFIESLESRFIRERILRIKEVDMTKKMKEVFEFIRRKLVMTQESQKKHADKKRIIASDYKEDDFVWLSTRNIRTTRFFKKLNWKMINLYIVKKILEANYQLKLSSSIIIHDIFYTFLLRKISNDSIFDQIANSSSSIVINQEEKFELNNVLNSRRVERNKKL